MGDSGKHKFDAYSLRYNYNFFKNKFIIYPAFKCDTYDFKYQPYKI
jgi:hypothetical protein